jgi:hypothetical protein
VPTGGADLQWQRFADDVLAVQDALGMRGCLGVGHSLGGCALLLAGALLCMHASPAFAQSRCLTHVPGRQRRRGQAPSARCTCSSRSWRRRCPRAPQSTRGMCRCAGKCSPLCADAAPSPRARRCVLRAAAGTRWSRAPPPCSRSACAPGTTALCPNGADCCTQALDTFASKPPLSFLLPECLHAYVQHGFRCDHALVRAAAAF